jgi:hypothetical protein
MPSGVFPKVTGELIFAADYNTIQSTIAAVMGIGAGDEGYGQEIVSSQIVPGTTAQVIQWSRLRTDMILARQHQTGVSESSNLALASSAISIDSTLANQYFTFANLVRSSRLTLATTGGNSSTETLVNQTRTANWNGTLTHTVTITFPGYTTGGLTVSAVNHARAFFNGGGQILISAAKSGGSTSASKNITWTTMLGDGTTPSGFGTISFNYTATTTVVGTASSAGTTYGIGWYDLSTSDQLIFNKAAPAGNYAANDYEVYARRDAGSTQLILTIQFKDDAGPNPNIDEDIDGNLQSLIRQVRPSGSNVSVPTPTASGSGLI